MNGRFQPLPRLPVPLAASPHRRLLVALAASVALHAAAILAPFLGASSENRATPSPARAPAISASLLVTRSDVAMARLLPPPSDAPIQTIAPAEPNPPSPAHTGLDMLPIPAPEYFATNQLSKRPQPLIPAELDTPETRQLPVSGKLVLTLWIDARGSVSDARVERTELPEVFGQAAVAGFKNARFTPGERDGKPVAVMMRVEVSYEDNRMPPR